MFFWNKRAGCVCALLCAALALGGCGGSTRDYEGEIDGLKRENVALDQQVQLYREEVARLRLTRLDSWQLEGWGESLEEPVTIRFRARPLEHEEGQQAALLILLDGQEVLQAPCTWDGELFLTDCRLSPADGYGYYCALTGPDGTVERIPLSTPEEPRVPKLTFLSSSLRLEATAVLTEIRLDRNQLAVDVTAAVQMPLLPRDGEPLTLDRAELEWLLDGGILEGVPVELGEGQTEGSFSGAASGVCLDVPKMSTGSKLELVFRVSFSDGQELTAPVGSWTMEEHTLTPAVG